MWAIVIFLFTGFIVGYFHLLPDRFLDGIGFITRVGLILLLTAMGAKIGVDDRILNQLDRIGIQALLIAIASITGSIILVKLFTYKFNVKVEPEEFKEEIDDSNTDHSMTIIIISSVIGGILAGLFILPDSFFSYLDSITTFALAALLFGVGVDIGLNKEILGQVREMSWQIVVIPLIVAVGSLGGAVLLGFFLGLSYNESAAVAAGFGWYSLSGILLSKLHSVELGSLAFLANVFRELITILILPIVVKYLGRLTAVAPGGATTMDVTLPLIKEAAGEETVIPAFINGVILSTLVPFLVPFLINL